MEGRLIDASHAVADFSQGGSAPSGESIYIDFKTVDGGTRTLAFKVEDLPALMGVMFQIASELNRAPPAGDMTVKATPIPSPAATASPGRSKDELFLAVFAAGQPLTFQLSRKSAEFLRDRLAELL